ncbi:hypothetical protein [African swine fever virus]
MISLYTKMFGYIILIHCMTSSISKK